MRSLFYFIFLSSAAVLFAQNQVTIDDYMSPSEQTQTGVSSLNATQKQALTDWISLQLAPTSQQPTDITTDPTQPTDPTKKQAKVITLSENLSKGEVLVLSDGTKWKIHPNDHKISSVWLIPNRIEISKGSDTKFPFVLTNKISNTSVLAQQYTAQTKAQTKGQKKS